MTRTWRCQCCKSHKTSHPKQCIECGKRIGSSCRTHAPGCFRNERCCGCAANCVLHVTACPTCPWSMVHGTHEKIAHEPMNHMSPAVTLLHAAYNTIMDIHLHLHPSQTRSRSKPYRARQPRMPIAVARGQSPTAGSISSVAYGMIRRGGRRSSPMNHQLCFCRKTLKIVSRFKTIPIIITITTNDY